jgi:hypothetical protein
VTTLGRTTRRFRTFTRPTVLGRSTICHWCGHPGAQDVDHHPIPWSILVAIDPRLAEDPANCAPIHGRQGCPLCPPQWSRHQRRMAPRKCNQEKGAKVNATPPDRGDW